ncbi:MAG: hypothetical protein ACJ76H_13545 [Bacteriovoracaceae bacterium]
MKTLTLLLSLIFALNSFAQGIDNNNSLDSQFSETKQLTDQQNDEAQTFIHKGIEDKKIQEGCADKLLKGCDPSEPDKMGVLFGGAIENQIGKLYAVIFGFGPMIMGGNKGSSGGDAKAPETKGADGKPADGKSQGKKKDYCIYLPIAYEALGFLIQMNGQKQAQQDSQNLDPQLAALVQLKEAHKTRKKTATQQSVVYGATAACYVATMFMPPAGKPDPWTIAKMAAAGGLSVLYMAKAKKHAAAAKKVQEVIDSLPKAGDCNPWTGTACFCSEKTSAKLYPGQYNEVCVLNKGNPDGPLSNMGCATQTNGQVALDATCGCKATNSCLSSKISLGNSQLGLGANFVNDANKALTMLDPSQFDEAKLGDFQSSMAAKLNNFKPNGSSPVPDTTLSPDQKAMADSLSNVVDPATASLAASLPAGSPPMGGLMGGSTASALDKLSPSFKKSMRDFEVSGAYRQSGAGSPTMGGGEQPGFSIPGMGGPQQPQGGTAVEEFAARAVDRGADVRNAPDTKIFDIISNRYRMSAWKRLNPE